MWFKFPFVGPFGTVNVGLATCRPRDFTNKITSPYGDNILFFFEKTHKLRCNLSQATNSRPYIFLR